MVVTEKQRITVWFDVDGVLKNDIEPFLQKFLPEEGKLNRGSAWLLRHAEEALFLASRPNIEILSMLRVNPAEGAGVRQEIIEVMKGCINAGAEIGLITANRHEDEKRLVGELRKMGITGTIRFERVNRAADKGRYIDGQEGVNILVDDNPEAFLSLRREGGNHGIIMITPYFGVYGSVIGKLRGVERVGVEELLGHVLSFLGVEDSN